MSAYQCERCHVESESNAGWLVNRDPWGWADPEWFCSETCIENEAESRHEARLPEREWKGHAE